MTGLIYSSKHVAAKIFSLLEDFIQLMLIVCWFLSNFSRLDGEYGKVLDMQLKDHAIFWQGHQNELPSCWMHELFISDEFPHLTLNCSRALFKMFAVPVNWTFISLIEMLLLITTLKVACPWTLYLNLYPSMYIKYYCIYFHVLNLPIIIYSYMAIYNC